MDLGRAERVGLRNEIVFVDSLILPAEVRVLFFLFDDLHLLGHVFGVGIVVEIPVGSLAVPVRASLQLVWKVSVVIFLRSLINVFFGIGRFASQGELSSCMFVCRLDVLIFAPVAWKLRFVRTQL